MQPTVTLPGADLYLGDSLSVLPSLQDGCVDAVVTDPPYHLSAGRGAKGGFMGQTWDGGDVAFRPDVWAECFRVTKPGAFLLAFGGTRTWHRLACAVEDAGWELTDTLCHLFGSGFPKAKSCLKPGWEPVIMARKPAPRVLPLNIDGARIACAPYDAPGDRGQDGHNRRMEFAMSAGKSHAAGRWPANVLLQHHESCVCRGTKRVRGSHRVCARGEGNVAKPLPKVNHVYGQFGGHAPHDFTDADGMETVEDWACHPECPVRLLDEQAGERGDFMPRGAQSGRRQTGNVYGKHEESTFASYGDSGGASRFFFCSKASKAERGEGNRHPTVKPLALCQWLCRLVSSPGDTILDPFQGSGTAGLAALSQGRRYVGIEKEPDYHAIAVRRLTEAAGPLFANAPATVDFDSPPPESQPTLFPL